VGISWRQHIDFLESDEVLSEAKAALKDCLTELEDHPALLGVLIGNEIESSLVRWMGPTAVQQFLETLIAYGKKLSPSTLFSYATYPSTEYLFPRNADFFSCNVYLEEKEKLSSYLQHLQNLAGNTPLLISEYGADSLSLGEKKQAELLSMAITTASEKAAAGHYLFSYSDLWERGGELVADWKFGITDKSGNKKPAALAIKEQWQRKLLESYTENELPGFSIIICTHNGEQTLETCLHSLQNIEYPNFEILVIDDGSSDRSTEIAQQFPKVALHQIEHSGLSAARNYGAEQSSGEILLWLDDDAYATPQWLSYLALEFLNSNCAAAGGPSITPPSSGGKKDHYLEQAPGRPRPVMINDLLAEHLPGCNFALHRSVFEKIGGFDPQFKSAGDDVDYCWRIIDAGEAIHFVPGAVVWHEARQTLSAYLRQQKGYRNAEKLLAAKYPKRFINTSGEVGSRARWQGRIYHGPYGGGLFQGIYGGSDESQNFSLSAKTATAKLSYCLGRMARFGWREGLRLSRATKQGKKKTSSPTTTLNLWSEQGLTRQDALSALPQTLQQNDWQVEGDDGWQDYDLLIYRSEDNKTKLISCTEYHGNNKTLTRLRLQNQGKQAVRAARTDELRQLESLLVDSARNIGFKVV